jgi:DNA polymerase II small subunit
VASDLREHLVAYFEEQHKLVEAGALKLLLECPQPLVLSRDVLDRLGKSSTFVTEAAVRAALADRGRPTDPRGVSVARPGEAAPPREVLDFSVVREGFAGPPPAGTPIDGYTRLFSARFRDLGRMLRGRSTLENPRSIRDLPATEGVVSVVGMVRQVKETSKSHHTILSVDDDTGSVDILVTKGSPALKLPFVLDEVVGLKVRTSRERDRLPLLIGLERPDVAVTRNVGRSDRARRAVLLSDLHVGSRAFLGAEWAALVDFLHGRGPEPELARTIDFAVIAGDLVDGIGIYPRQEKDVAITDVVEQYAELGRRLRELPERITIVAVPGNHDAVSPAEPQPALPANLVKLLPPNVRVLANPSTFALAGVTVVAYHGRGFDDLIPAIPNASYARPTEVMRRMLQMRHLAPIYGNRTPLAPAVRDGLVIDPVPDIFVTGHLHTFGIDRYRDVLLVNASTWQGETQYQKMRNITPAPCRAAIVDLRSLDTRTLNCASGRPVLEGTAA